MMKKKIDVPPVKQRFRRSNAEILKLPGGAMRKMREISEATRLPLDIVYDDALSIGLCGVSELYETLIQERRKLTERFERNLRGEPKSETKTEPEGSVPSDRSGSVGSPEWDLEDPVGTVTGSPTNSEERSGDVAERSGQSSADSATPGMVIEF